MNKVTLGVLELQGDFYNHAQSFLRIGANCVPIRRVKDLQQDLSGIVMPGGESTTMSIMLKKWQLEPVLKNKINAGLPVFATCAGSILIASEIRNNHYNQPIVPLKAVNLVVDRNGFGRQIDSFETKVNIKLEKEEITIPGVFIRAPRFIKITPPAIPIGTIKLDDGKTEIVAVKQNNIIAISFHPELTDNLELQKYFVNICNQWKKTNQEKNIG